MKITEIVESGNQNIIRWAIADNAAEIKGNLPLTSIINDDMFYLVKIDHVNFYELVRLTQLYRNKLKICNVHRAKIPSQGELEEWFPGFEEPVRKVLEMFTGLTAQMLADSDIIAEGTGRLFLPMITTTFTVQIPLAFIDVVEACNEVEAGTLFTQYYPDTLMEIFSYPSHSLINATMAAIQSNVSYIWYDRKYESLLEHTKYFSLREIPGKLFKIGLLSFFKFDPVSRGEVRCNMFRGDPQETKEAMRSMWTMRSPLELSVCVQLPIYYMQLLEESYFPDDLRISHRSSIRNIVKNGLLFHDFNSVEDDEERENAINVYRVRITETNLTCMKLINDISGSGNNNMIKHRVLFSILPPAYLANAVITMMAHDIPKFIANSDPIISDLFTEIQKLATTITTGMEESYRGKN